MDTFHRGLSKKIWIECHICEWEHSHERDSPSDLGRTISHAAGTDSEVKLSENDNARDLDGKGEEDGALIKAEAAFSSHGCTPLEEFRVSRWTFSLSETQDEDRQTQDKSKQILERIAKHHLSPKSLPSDSHVNLDSPQSPRCPDCRSPRARCRPEPDIRPRAKNHQRSHLGSLRCSWGSFVDRPGAYNSLQWNWPLVQRKSDGDFRHHAVQKAENERRWIGNEGFIFQLAFGMGGGGVSAGFHAGLEPTLPPLRGWRG